AAQPYNPLTLSLVAGPFSIVHFSGRYRHMSQEIRCSFCEQLPGIFAPGITHRPSKCPLCREAVWVTPDSVTYRLYSEEERAIRPAPRRQWPWIAGVGLAACIGLVIALGSFTSRSKE